MYRILAGMTSCAITILAALSYGHPDQGIENLGTAFLWFYLIVGIISGIAIHIDETQERMWEKHVSHWTWPYRLTMARAALLAAVLITAYDGRFFFTTMYIICALATEAGYLEIRQKHGEK